MRKLTTEEWVQKAIKTHGLKYDYTSTVYNGSANNVKIICPSCGVFEQNASHHLQGSGCPKCLKMTTDKFILRAAAIHNNKYDYTFSNCSSVAEKTTIVCPIHGRFTQRVSVHLGGAGCNKCGELSSSNKQAKTSNSFIAEAKNIHKSNYDYSLTKYVNAHTKVKIICPIHREFEQVPHQHLQGRGCAKCAYENNPQNNPYTTEQFIQNSKKVHGDLYDYSKTVYVNANENVIITCKIHGDFLKRAGHHIEGSGCQTCAKYGFDQTKSAYLYYLKIITDDGQILYKIGITNRTVNERFGLKDLKRIEIVKQKLYEKGTDAMNWETKLKRKYKEYQYKGPAVLENGNTELFTEDIISMWPN